MMRTVIARPVNSILFVEDRGGGKLPEWNDDKLILATESCILVRCNREANDNIEITIKELNSNNIGYELVIDRVLHTPSHIVAVTTVDEQVLIEFPVPSTHTRIRIWVNDTRWPDKIMIGVNK